MAILASPHIVSFVLASLILAIVPGPAVVYLLTQTLTYGRKAGLWSVGGVALGNFANATAALLGLAAILQASATAFMVVKVVGALYLIYLGLRTLRGNNNSAPIAKAGKGTAARTPFRDGVFVAALNPKTTLFFAAFLPQFIDAHAAAPLEQGIVLAVVFVALALCTDTLYVMTAARIGGLVRGQPRWLAVGRYLSAGTFICLGVYAAFATPRSAR